jgi:hypothetical protein
MYMTYMELNAHMELDCCIQYVLLYCKYEHIVR